MQGEKPLSELYRQYSSEGLERKEFEGRIFRYLLGNFDRYHIFNANRERWNEFLSWLYPRLTRAVDLYRDTGSSFDAYITGLVHNAAREFRYREVNHHITEYACWQARAEEMRLLESEPEYSDDRKEVFIPREVNPRQILFLLLKSYFFVSDDFIKRVALTIDMNNEAIGELIAKLRQQRSGQDTEILGFRDRLHCQYYRCLAYQKRMCAAQPGTDYFDKMKGCFERAKSKFYAMKERFGKMRLAASNRLIAEVMGVPKGTVDSGIFSIKNFYFGNKRYKQYGKKPFRLV